MYVTLYACEASCTLPVTALAARGDIISSTTVLPVLLLYAYSNYKIKINLK